MDLVELSRLLENLIRIGTIHAVDHAAVRVRVQTGRIVTGWLRWMEHRAGETTTWDPPTIGEQCLVLSPSGELAQGIVIRGAHSNLIEPPSHSPARHVIRFPDGAVFSYDHVASHLEISGIKTAAIIASESITHDTPLTHMTGKCVIDDLLTYNNGLAGYPGTNGSEIVGDMRFRDGAHEHTNGSIHSNGLPIDHTHRHVDVYPGSGTSGIPT